MSYRHPSGVEALLRSLVEVVCPPDVVRLDLVEAVVEHTHLTMGAQAAPIRAAFTLGMRAYDLGSIPRYGRPARLLPLAKRQAYFASWWHNRVALLQTFAKSTKGMLCLGYYEMPAVHDAMGYTPQQWVDKVAARRLAVFSDDIRRHETALRTPDPLPSGHFATTNHETLRDAS